ncbi:MAG: hypothetical protein ACFFCP_11760 [Promethearchaeota archaeon]
MKSNTRDERIQERLKLVTTNAHRILFGFCLILLVISPFAIKSNFASSQASGPLSPPSTADEVSAEIPLVYLYYTTRTLLTDTPVNSGDIIAGDHVTLKSSWQPVVTNSRLEVHAPAIPATLSLEENQSILEIDTRYLGNNATCSIIASTRLTNGTILSKEFTNVYIGNFFAPKVTVISPNGGEDWQTPHNITWSASDVNADDTLLFDVLYSDDAGASFNMLVKSTTQSWFEWDCSGLNQGDTYLVEVRATDGIYFSSDRSDATFSAGSIVTTTTTTTTTSTPPTIEPRILVFVALLLVSSTVMALVVYYAAKKWF